MPHLRGGASVRLQLGQRRSQDSGRQSRRVSPGEMSTSTSTMYPSRPTMAQVLDFASMVSRLVNWEWGHEAGRSERVKGEGVPEGWASLTDPQR